MVKKSLAGFTLIEITIALLILAVGLVGILTLFPVGFNALGKAARMTNATFLAQEVMEGQKVLGYSGVTPTTSRQQFPAPNENYGYEVLVTDDPTGGGLGMKQVEVRVYSPVSDSAPLVQLQTNIADYAP